MLFGKCARLAPFFAIVCAAYADILVVPNAQANATGNNPFKAGSSGVRIQEVVGSGQFPGPVTIQAIRIRAFPGTGPVNLGTGTLKLTLSTTNAYPNTTNGHTLPSSTFANNIGPDATVVYNGILAASSPGCAAPGPCPFDMVIRFTAPFFYDPNKGRLLVDLTSTDSPTPTAGQFDGIAFADSTTSSVAIVFGDPALKDGAPALAGIILGLESGTANGPAPTVTGVRNSFSFGTELSPGVLAAIIGSNFGSSAGDVAVTVGGKAAYVSFASPGQLNVQIPFEAPVGSNAVIVTVAGTSSAPFNITLANYAPAFSTFSGSGAGLGVVQTTKNVQLSSVAPGSPGDTLIAYLTGLGPTNPPTSTGLTPAGAPRPTATAVTMTVGGINAQVTFAGLVPGNAGLYQINFVVPPGVQGSRLMVVTIGGVSTKGVVTVPLFGITSIVNNASQASIGTAAAGSFVTIKANGLGSTDQLTGFPATKFQGVQVTFNGIPAPLFHLIANPPPGASANARTMFEQQIDLLVPNELPTLGNVNVQLTTPAAFYPNFGLSMAAAVPGIYRIADPSVSTRFNVIAQFNNTVWLAMPASTATALQLPGNCSNSGINVLSLCGQPATIGDFLVLYLTGLGVTTPGGDPNGKPLPTGVAPPSDGSVLYRTTTVPTVTVGGVPVTVLYSGLPPGFAGLYQVVFQVPSGVASGNDVPVTVTMLGRQDTATISIQPRP